MEHYFEVPVIYKGEELSFKGRLSTFGFTYKFFIVVNGKELVFEKENEGSFKLITEINNTQIPVDTELINTLETLLVGIGDSY